MKWTNLICGTHMNYLKNTRIIHLEIHINYKYSIETQNFFWRENGFFITQMKLMRHILHLNYI